MDDLDDFNADFNDDSRRNRRMFAGLIVGAVLLGGCGLAACGGLVWWFVDRAGELPVLGGLTSATMPETVDESREEKQAWAKAAFADPPPAAFERRPIEALFRQIATACQADDDAAFQSLVNGAGYWQAMKESGLLTSLSRWEDSQYADTVVSTLEVPGAYDRFHVQSISEGRTADEAVVYAIAEEPGWQTEMRWWLVRRGPAWQVTDWESLQLGRRQSARHAAYFAEMPGATAHEAAMAVVTRADEAMAEGRIGDAVRDLHQAEARRVPEFFQSEHRLDVAFAWARAGRLLHARRVYHTTPEALKEQSPGLLLGQADSELDARHYDDCLALIDRYEQAVGGGPNVDRVRGDALFATGQVDESAICYRRLLRLRAHDLEEISDLAARLPATDVPAIVNALRQQPDPVAAAIVVASSVPQQPQLLEALESLVREIDSDSATALILKGDRLAAEGAIDAAGEAYVAAAETLPAYDPQADPSEAPTLSRDDAVSRLVMMYCEAERALDGYRAAPDKAAAFELIQYYSDDYGLDTETMNGIAEAHWEEHPDDPAALAWMATSVAGEGDVERAVELIQEAAEENPLMYGDQLVMALVDADRLDEAERWIRDHPDQISAFDVVAGQLIEDERFQRVLDLADAMDRSAPGAKLRLVLREAEALVALQRYDAAERALHTVYTELEDDWMKSSLLQRWYELANDAGRPPERIAERVGLDALNVYISRAAAERDFETVRRLEQVWSLRGGDAAAVISSSVARLWHEQAYADLLSKVLGVGVDAAAASEGGAIVLDRYVRSLIRLKRTDEALREARQAYDQTADARIVAVASIAARDWDSASAAVAILDDYQRSRLFIDRDAGPVLAAGDARAFRQSLRHEASDLTAVTTAVLLLSDSVADTPETIASRLQTELKKSESADVTPRVTVLGLQADEPALLVHHDGGCWIVSIGQGSYLSTDADTRPNSETLHAAIESHAGWIAIDETLGSWATPGAGHALIAAVAAALDETVPLAVQLSDRSLAGSYGGYAGRLVPWSSSLQTQLTQDDFHAGQAAGGEPWWLYRESENDEPSRDHEQSLRRFAVEFAQSGDRSDRYADGVFFLPHGELPVRVRVEAVFLYPHMTEVVGTVTSEFPEGLADGFAIQPEDHITLSSWYLRGWGRL